MLLNKIRFKNRIQKFPKLRNSDQNGIFSFILSTQITARILNFSNLADDFQGYEGCIISCHYINGTLQTFQEQFRRTQIISWQV